MKDILLVTDIFPPQIGGPATFIDELAHELTRQKLTVTVVCTSEQRTESSDKARPFRVVRVFHGSSTKLFHARMAWALGWGALTHRKVFANGLEYQTCLVCSRLRKPFTLKIVGDLAWEKLRVAGETQLSIDDFQTARPEGDLARKWLGRRSLYVSRAKHIITPSEYVRGLVIGWGVPPEKVTAIPNGIRGEKYAGFAPRRRDVREALNVIYVGRLTNWKGVDTLLAALEPLTNIRATIVGDGPELGALKAMAETLGLAGKVNFVGRQSGDATLEFMRKADVLVLSSGYEGMAHTLLEASAVGLASIASNCGGNPETIVDGKTGVLIPVLNVDALRAALVKIRDDEEFRFGLACAAKRATENFKFVDTVKRTAGIIREN